MYMKYGVYSVWLCTSAIALAMARTSVMGRSSRRLHITSHHYKAQHSKRVSPLGSMAHGRPSLIRLEAFLPSGVYPPSMPHPFPFHPYPFSPSPTQLSPFSPHLRPLRPLLL